MKVSVIIPVYNAERFLRPCLDSVYAQTLRDFEVILINDGSADSSLEIIREYMDRYPEKTICRTVDNGGQGYIVCACIEENENEIADVKTYKEKMLESAFNEILETR